MHTDAERTLCNLHVVGAISHNDKIMTNEDVFDIYAPTTFRAFFRTYYRENRSDNISRVKQTVRSGFSHARSFHDQASTLLRSQQSMSDSVDLNSGTLVMQHIQMCNALAKAKEGLRHLSHTYRDDSASVSAVEYVITDITDFFTVMGPKTEKIKKFLPREDPSEAPPLASPPSYEEWQEGGNLLTATRGASR